MVGLDMIKRITPLLLLLVDGCSKEQKEPINIDELN